MAKKTNKKKVNKKMAVEPKAVRVPAVCKKLGNFAVNLRDVSGMPTVALSDARDKIVASIDRLAICIEKSFINTAKNAERAKTKAKRDVEKVERDKIRAAAKAKRDVTKTERINAKNARKAEQIKALRAKIAKLED